MNKIKKQGKRVLSFLLCTALAMSGLMVPTKQVRAVETQAEENTGNTKTIAGLGTSVIVDPTAPASNTDAWKGSYVYYGNYDADGDGTAEPVKYRVLDASTTNYSADGTTQTMFLDCDSILYYTPFDSDNTANKAGKKASDWSISDVKYSLNGGGFLNKEGVFTTAEKNAIAKSNVATHALTTDSENGINVASWTKSAFVNYVALTGEQIFLLDAEDVSNGAYGYSMASESCENRKKKTGSSADDWWLRSAGNDNNNIDIIAGYVDGGGINYSQVINNNPGVSPAFNVKLSSVLFSSVISGTSGETGAEYKLTLLDADMTIAANSDATRYGKTVTVPYSISGTNSANATQVSVLVLDKEYTAGNTNGATVLDYQKLNVDSFSASGTVTYTLPDSLYRKGCGTDYHMYILAEDVNGEKETDYASTPVEITPTWKAPTVKQMNFGTQGIIDPAVPNSASDAWKGCYVYYGNYDADVDGAADPVKYRVLDASTTDYSADGMTQTMLLDCDSILYYTPFDGGEPYSNVWKDSPIYKSLNGDGFLNKEGVFTTAEKNAIAASTVDTHALTTDGETGVNVASWTQSTFGNYVALTGEQIFLLDAEDVSNGAYGYSMTDEATENRKKKGRSAEYWWLRSARNNNADNTAGCVDDDGRIDYYYVDYNYPRVSPALNLNLSSVLFSSANAVSKSSALTSGSTAIGTEANTDWKLTLKDNEKFVALTEGRSVTKASDGTITVPYTYKDKENATEKEKVNQISVMITDKAYDAEKAVNAQEAQILYYGALQDIKNAEGNESTVAETSTGTGTFALPSGLTEKTQGEDYHIYLLAEHVNDDNNTDYASEPLEVEVKTPIETVTVPSIDTPIAEEPLKEEITVSSTGVAEKATLTWKKNDTEATDNAQWKTTYQAYVTLTAADGYAFTDTTGAILNEDSVDTENITMNEDGTLTIACGEYTTATRKTEGAAAPEVPTQFANYYTADNVLSSTELGIIAKVTLEGKSQPNPEEMEVEWSLANEGGAAYDATPTATNTFKWTVKASEYADYDLNGVTMEGTVTIQNKRYIPEVASIPTVAERVYHPTKVLTDTDLTDGEVKDKGGTVLAGAWSWKKQNIIPSVADSEKTQYEITFTPKDAEHYEPITTAITIKVTKATPMMVARPSATDIVSGNTLASSVLSGGKVQYGESDTTEVAGTWSWKDATIKPSTADSGVTEYDVVFVPTDAVNYNSVETKITVLLSTPTTGTIDTSDDGKATYKVTTADLTNGTVTYVAPTNKKATTVTIPDTVVMDGVTYKVTSVEKGAFKNNKKIKKVTIGKNVKTIGKEAFSGCTKLKTVKLGGSVTSIGDKAFYKNTTLTSISLPSKVSTIGKSAFEGCKKVTSVTIGKNVSKIDSKAFYGCSKLKTLTIKSSKLTTKKIGSKAFTKTPKSMTVKVPKKKFDAYKTMLMKRGVNKKARFKKN